MHIALRMSEPTEAMEFSALLDAVRGGGTAATPVVWDAWAEKLDAWVEAYPAFGAGRMMRAKTARETRALAAAERLAEAAVFSSEPGRLFDLLFRAGIESEIASFARAVEALEPQVEDALRLRWHPEHGGGTTGAADTAAEEVEETEETEEVSAIAAGDVSEEPVAATEEEERAPEVDIPEKGSLAREVVLGAIERSIEKEIRAFSEGDDGAAAQAGEGEEKGASFAAAALAAERKVVIDVAAMSPLARWAYERSEATGFTEAAESRLPSEALRAAASRMEEVMDAAKQADGETAAPEGGLEQQAALIDLFIRNEPSIGPIRPEIERPTVKELAKESLVEDASLITETMARIYAAQGQIGRARRAYKLLALKYPEKSVYFAAQSKKLGRKAEDD